MANLKVGDVVPLTGYVGFTKSYCGKSASELEQIVGYNCGALAAGYWFARLEEPIQIGDFEFRGDTRFSGGVPKGSSSNTHDAMKTRLSLNPIDRATFQNQLLKAVERLNQKGADRVCKIIPKVKPTEYPPGWGIVQFELLRQFPRAFRIDAEVGPGQMLFRRPDDTIYLA